MREGKCSRCGSNTVYARQNGLQIGEHSQGVIIFTSWLTTPTPTVTFICTSCGYFESFITDQKKLNEVAQSWAKVGIQ